METNEVGYHIQRLLDNQRFIQETGEAIIKELTQRKDPSPVYLNEKLLTLDNLVRGAIWRVDQARKALDPGVVAIVLDDPSKAEAVHNLLEDIFGDH
ncbi:MAG: hypothetical protein PHI12_07930 [Dehalococcoidales bacterium]|jgi:hypothetical protein|nr:hypothetical protein [Sphaerochaeta sp.]MDD5510722.1 hypothetical protein [Dehalococcoidales bacterium]